MPQPKNEKSNKQAFSISRKLYSAEQVRHHEAQAAELSGCDLYTLMQRAGRAAFDLARQRWPHSTRWLVLAGVGNNAGDAYVTAALAKNTGVQVTLCAALPAAVLKGDAKRAQESWQSNGGLIDDWQSIQLSNYDVVIDGLLGTGISRPVASPFSEIISEINNDAIPVLSLDLPSGMQADTGQAQPICVQADTTITFVGIKPGLVTGIGKHYCGELVFDDLAVGEAFDSIAQPMASNIAYAELLPLPARALHSHKGHFGRLLCIGGSQGMAGALRLSGEAALRTGAGLVKLYPHASQQHLVNQSRPELMVAADLTTALNWANVILIGPGLGQDNWALDCLSHSLMHAIEHHKPIVIDADGLNLLANFDKQLASFNHGQCILTPHPGEAATLLETSTQEIEANRYQAALQIAEQYQAATILKGAGTVIAENDGRSQVAYVCQDGNPGMATAGMGDVLAGMLAALFAQGLSASEASRYGVCIHAAAADRVAALNGQRGMIATDVINQIQPLVNFL